MEEGDLLANSIGVEIISFADIRWEEEVLLKCRKKYLSTDQKDLGALSSSTVHNG